MKEPNQNGLVAEESRGKEKDTKIETFSSTKAFKFLILSLSAYSQHKSEDELIVISMQKQ